MLKIRDEKKAQVSLFVILAIILVFLILILYSFRSFFIVKKIPASINPAYEDFLSCLSDKVISGISLLETQGGYLYVPKFVPGSDDAPFSSQLDFLGNPVPYWSYLSSNGKWENQIPSKQLMEEQLGTFIDKNIYLCNFNKYSSQGLVVKRGVPNSSVSIKKDSVNVDLKMELVFDKGGDHAEIKESKIKIKSKLGSLYDSSKKLYDNEKKSMFLENYTIDVLRLYAPVDGVELSCAPKIWNVESVFSQLKKAIQVNINSLKTKSGNYQLNTNKEKYFIIDSNANAKFLTSSNWPSSFEVLPSENNLLIANPIGNQQGLGILGFCVVPYHFVYNIKYPVLVQVYDGSEIFQFPLAVVINKNKPINSLNASSPKTEIPDFCKYKNTNMIVRVFDNKLNPIDANISYQCSGSVCKLGSTTNGFLNASAPQCFNGYVLVSSNGFLDSMKLYSNIEPGEVSIVMNKTYVKKINLKLNGRDYNGPALITFESPSFSESVAYPEKKEAKITSGKYLINVYIFKNSTLKLKETTKEQCMDVPKPGILGELGLKTKKCFNVKVPSQMISQVLAGGGSVEHYFLSSNLENSSIIDLDVTSLPEVNSLDQLQKNYILFKYKKIKINLK